MMSKARVENDDVKVTIGGGLVQRLLPYLISGGIGASAIAGVGMLKNGPASPTSVEVANLQIQVAALQSDVKTLQNTTQNTEGKVDTILRLMRNR